MSSGRALTGTAWAVLVLGVWLWGRDAAPPPGAAAGATTGGIAAVGGPPDVALPPGNGAIEPPPFGTPRTVGWYGAGTRPGAPGAALLVGHVDTATRPAVFYGLSAVRPGAAVAVTRSDGSIADFTIDDIQVLPLDGFDARAAYGRRQPDRAELRPITRGGAFDRASGSYTANVVVSAYLTGVREAAEDR